jgi:chromate transporter
LAGFLLYFLKLGTLGFGGPIALAGAMQRDLVEKWGWISLEEYKEGLALAQLAPGPLAAQLSIYLGWLKGGFVGATLVGVAFILPSFLMVLVLAWFYIHFQGLTWIQSLFYGIGAAVIALITQSAYKLIKRTLQSDKLLWILFGISAVLTAVTETEYVIVFFLFGIVAMLVKAPPKGKSMAAIAPIWLVTGQAGPKDWGTVGDILAYFAKAGAVVFGSGLAIVPFLHGGVVQQHSWLTERQFLDAVAVAMVTPGPVVITVAFIGALVAGLAGACAAAAGVFLPCYLVVILAAPYYRRFAQNPQIKALVSGVTAAAIGAIAGAVIVLGRRAITDVPTVLIFLASLMVVFRFKKVPEPILILAAGIIGLVLRGF